MQASKNRNGFMIGLVGGLVALVLLLSLTLLLNPARLPVNSKGDNPSTVMVSLSPLAEIKGSPGTDNPETPALTSVTYPVLDYPAWQKADLPDKLIQQAIALDNVSNIAFTSGEFYTINPAEVAKFKAF
ncbi:MAG TPA: hypothetical protein VH186_02560 [Chloroflexia bacterium]|nr:hypothetical protein [Chloroflexia bacterium]